MLKLNRTGNALNRETRNNDNDNWAKLEKKYNNVVGEITEEVFDKIVDGSKIDWSQMVDTVADFPSGAVIGETRGVKEDNKIYRFDGSNWIAIAEINLNPIAEVDERLSAKLTQTELNIVNYVSSSYSGLINRKEPRPMITWIDDDGQLGIYNKLRPLFNARNIPLTVAATTNRIDNMSGYMSTEQLHIMHDEGHEIMAHGHDHLDGTSASKDELREEYRKAREYLFKNGFNYYGLVYPYNRYNNTVDAVAREFYDYALGSLADDRADFAEPPINMYRLRRYSVDKYSLAEIKQLINDARNKNEWIVLYGHIDQENWWDEKGPEFVEGILDHALSVGMEFVHTNEAVKYHGNLYELDRLNNIDKFGEPHGREMATVHVGSYGEYTLDKDIEDYKRGITLQRIRASEADDTPNKQPGTVMTLNLGGEYYWNRQIYIQRNSSFLAQRRPSSSGGWSRWEFIGNYITPSNQFTADNKPSDFSTGVTLTRVTAGQAGGLPFDRGGILKTVTTTSQEGWNYQEFKEYKGSLIARRHQGDGDKWSSWYLEGEYQAPANFTDGDMQPEDFLIGTITNIVRGGTDLPYTSGILKTIKTASGSEDFWTVQEFYAVNHQSKYMRFADKDGGWHVWEKIG